MRRTWLCLGLAAASTYVPGQEAAPLPWKVNPPIATVQKEVYYKHPRSGAAALVFMQYVGPGLERMETRGLEVQDDVHSERTWRLSTDNGRTWSEPVAIGSTAVTYSGVGVWEGSGPRLFDAGAGVLVETWLRQIAVKGQYDQSTYWRLSRDFGKTWSEPKMLRYEAGDEFDPKNPLAPGFLKTNQAYFGSNILKHSNGTLIHAVAHANAPGDTGNDTRAWRMGSLCFVGRWNPQAKDYEWTAGKRVETTPDRSSRGLMEPEVAELKDGRVLVVWRGSNTGTTPGRKFCSVSNDGGLTLGPVEELKYDDGTSFYSPSSYHRMIRHSVTGKLYWVGNISATPPSGNSPRYPLVIAEVDETLPALKKNTVMAIDDRQPNQTEAIQFSNFSLLEDRPTHALELYLTAYGEFPGSVFDADCYKYLVTLK
jgi:hypothetical protein